MSITKVHPCPIPPSLKDPSYHPELNPIRPLVNTETGTKPEVTGSDLSCHGETGTKPEVTGYDPCLIWRDRN